MKDVHLGQSSPIEWIKKKELSLRFLYLSFEIDDIVLQRYCKFYIY